MNGFLLDTNVPSEILCPRPDSVVSAWLKAQAKESLFLSAVTVGEFRKGAELLPQSARRLRLESAIDVFVPF